MKWIPLMFLILAGGVANAETLTGFIRNHGAETPLELSIEGDAHVYQINASGEMQMYLRRMRTGDRLTAQGTLQPATPPSVSSVQIDSIDRMGLQEILGAWKSSRWEIFEFVNYDQLNLYVPTESAENLVSLSKTHSLKYVMTPQQDDRFTIFISDNNDVRMGFIEVGKNKLTLSVTDFKTGRFTENISLSPLQLQ